MTQQQLENLIDGKLMISDIIEINDPDEFERRLFVLSIAEDGNIFVYDGENDDIVSLDVILNEEFSNIDADAFQIYRLGYYDSDLPKAMKNYEHFTDNDYIQHYYRVLIDKGGSLDLIKYADEIQEFVEKLVEKDLQFDDYIVDVRSDSEHKISIEIKFS